MPKQRITREMVIETAFRLLRDGGDGQVLVKNIAAALDCSVQPIYSYCESMEVLRQELARMSARFLREYVGARIDRGNLFESTGKAYLAFAKEEPHLFKSYFLHSRDGINSFDDLYAAEASADMAAYIANTLGISESRAKALHMNMIVYNTGLSFLLLSAGGKLPQQELNDRLMSAYNAFLTEAKDEGETV